MTIASKELRIKAVEAYKTGKFTQQQLADAYCVHYKTIQNWLKADANNEEQVPKKNEAVVLVFLTKRKKMNSFCLYKTNLQSLLRR